MMNLIRMQRQPTIKCKPRSISPPCRRGYFCFVSFQKFSISGWVRMFVIGKPSQNTSLLTITVCYTGVQSRFHLIAASLYKARLRNNSYLFYPSSAEPQQTTNTVHWADHCRTGYGDERVSSLLTHISDELRVCSSGPDFENIGIIQAGE